MPSADTAPSLLSRLSPAPPYPAVSRSSPGRELPPHLQHALDNDVRLGRSPPTSSSFPASPPKPSGLSSSPPKPSTSPRKGTLRSPQPGSHLSSLPDDFLSRTAQPIPAARSTRSSRWAASPPTSPALGGTSSSPQAVFGSPSSLRSASAATAAAAITSGATPIAIKLGSSPARSSGLSPPRASASGALNQIESMLAQLRATPTSSPPKASTSVPKPSSSLPRHSPLVGATSVPPSVPAAVPPLPAAASAPVPAPVAASTSPKKKVLGGRSKWARADDDEPDEFASVEEKDRRQQGALAGGETAAKDEPASPAPPVPAVAPAASTASPPEPAPAPAAVPPSAPAPTPTPAPPLLENRPSFAPSVATIRTETANAHLSWADDDDDELPDLDDWGIPASSLPPPSFDDLDEPAPRQPPWASTAPPQQQHQHSLPPLGARRRSHSNASGGGGGKHGHGHGHGSGRQARSPPNQHAQPPHHAIRSPPTSPRAAAATTQPLKPPSRLFASAARAATAGAAGAGAGAGARELPPHVIPHPAQAPSSSASAPPPTKPRERMAPSSALFSRLSGIGPPSAAGSGSGSGAGVGVGAGVKGAPPTAGHAAGSAAGAAAGNKRRSKAGKPRASGAAVGAPAPSSPAPARFAPAPEGGSWRARGPGEGGAAASRWAQS
ncbi:hypothetical protein JCM8208_005654 [Rhodotorula glutinis]